MNGPVLALVAPPLQNVLRNRMYLGFCSNRVSLRVAVRRDNHSALRDGGVNGGKHTVPTPVTPPPFTWYDWLRSERIIGNLNWEFEMWRHTEVTFVDFERITLFDESNMASGKSHKFSQLTRVMIVFPNLDRETACEWIR